MFVLLDIIYQLNTRERGREEGERETGGEERNPQEEENAES